MTLELIPVSQLPADDHAICPCGGLMCFDPYSGDLVCQDCQVRALSTDSPKEES